MEFQSKLPPAQAPKTKYFLVDTQGLADVHSLAELESHLESFQIEMRLELVSKASLAGVVGWLRKRIIDLEAEAKGNLLVSIALGGLIENIKSLIGRLSTFDPNKIERVYLYRLKVSPSGFSPFFTSDRYLVVVVHKIVPGGRWVMTTSTALVESVATALLNALRVRVIQQKGTPKQKNDHTGLQKPKVQIHQLDIPQGEEIFVLDTNMFYRSEFSKSAFCGFKLSNKRHSIVVISPVLREIEKMKISGGREKASAIQNAINSAASKMADKENKVIICKNKGVEVRLIFELLEPEGSSYPPGLSPDLEDDKVIVIARSIQSANPKNIVRVVTEDPGVVIKAKAFGISVVDVPNE